MAVTAIEIGLGALLLINAVAGCAFAFNVWGIADRIARRYVRSPWLFRKVGQLDNPFAWRLGGLMMLTFGLPIVGWLMIETAWRFPVMNRFDAAWVLAGLFMMGMMGLVRGAITRLLQRARR